MHSPSAGPYTIARLLPNTDLARPLIRGISTQAEGADYLERLSVATGNLVLVDRDGHVILADGDELMADAAFRIAH